MPASSTSLRGSCVREPPQVHLGRLVGAVLAPHDRVDGQFGVGRPAAEDRDYPLVLGRVQAKLGVRLRSVRCRRRIRNCVVTGGAVTAAAPVFTVPPSAAAFLAGHALTSPAVAPETAEAKKPRPSVPGPVSASMACSGCGIRPTTFPAGFEMPAMPPAEPFGLAPR